MLNFDGLGFWSMSKSSPTLLDRELLATVRSGMFRSQADAVQEAFLKAYRALGHFIAKIDPFGRERPRPKALTLEYFGLSQSDLDKRNE